MNQNKFIKYIVPVVAVLVLFESVVLISNLAKNKTDPGRMEPVTEEEVMEAAFDLAVKTETDEMVIGNESVVEVEAMTVTERSLDSVNVYVKYNPAAFDITGMTFGERMPEPTFAKASDVKGMVVVNFLISQQEGLRVEAGENLALVKFTVVPKMTGKYEFEISSGEEQKESVTMFVENATSEILPFTSSKLTVNVGR